ncbi:MAG: SPASM domain-containing protein [Planctomycetota bacterium]
MNAKRFFKAPALDPSPEATARRAARLEEAARLPRPAPLGPEEKAQIEAEQFALLREDMESERTEWRSRPYYVQLSAHNICNLDCIMCWDGIHPTPARMTEEQIQLVGDELLPTASVIIPHSGSEPSLPGFIDIVPESARRYRTQIQFITNGTYLDRTNYERIRDTVAMIQVSLDAHIRETFDIIRVGADYDQVFANLRQLVTWCREDGIELAVSFVFLKANAYELPEFVRFMGKEIGVDSVIVQQLYDNNERGKELDAYGNIPDEDIEQLRLESIRIAKEVGVDLSMGLGGFEWHRNNGRETRENRCHADSTRFLLYHHRSFCQQAAQYLKVDVNGDVYPCCHGGDPPDLKMGNLFESSLEEVWNGPEYQKLRSEFQTGELRKTCRECVFFRQNSGSRLYEVWLDFKHDDKHEPSDTLQGFHVQPKNLTFEPRTIRGTLTVRDEKGSVTKTFAETFELEPHTARPFHIEVDLASSGPEPLLEVVIEDVETGQELARRAIRHQFRASASV